jgi:hypothetical protein
MRHTADLFFSAGSVDSDVQPRDVTQYASFVSYSFLHSVREWNIRNHSLEVYIGAGLSSLFTYTDFIATDKNANYKYYDQSWYWSHALDFHILGEYQFDERRTLSVQFTTPIVRLVARPENGHEFNEQNMEVTHNFFSAVDDGKAEFFWENLVIRWEAAYSEQLSKQIGVRCAYSFTYASSDKPLSMGMYWNNFLVGVFWLL